MIIAIHGKKQTGKDTIAYKLQYLFYQDGINLYTKSFAYPIKKFVADILGCDIVDFNSEQFKNSKLPSEWDYNTIYHYRNDSRKVTRFSNNEYSLLKSIQDTKKVINHSMTPRDLLVGIGTEAARRVHPDIWVNTLLSKYDGKEDWVINDLRFDNEFNAVKELGGFIIKVKRSISNRYPDLYKEFINSIKSVKSVNDYGNSDISDKAFMEYIKHNHIDFYTSLVNKSEVDLDDKDDIDFDFTIVNNGNMEHLEKQIVYLYNILKTKDYDSNRTNTRMGE